MIGALFCAAALSLPMAEEVRWYALDLGAEPATVTDVTAEQAQAWAKEQGWSFSLEEPPAPARPIGYAGEEKGLLWTLLGMGWLDTPILVRDLWLTSPELGFRVSGLGTRVSGDRAWSRALIAPLSGKRWLLGVDSPAQLDLTKLRLNLKSPAVRASLAARLQSLLRDGHAARNSGKKKPPRLGYPGLGFHALLEIGDLASEESFSVQTVGDAQRRIETRTSALTLENFVDDGVVLPPGASLRWSLDLQSLISDDLILFGTSAESSGRGEILVDGVSLAQWIPRSARESGWESQWFECVTWIPNRLLAGKERATFELRPGKNQTVSVFRLQFLRLPPPHGEYLSNRSPKKSSSHASLDRAVGVSPLVCGGYRFFRGLGVEAPSEIVYEIAPTWKEVEAFVGVDDSSPAEGPVAFQIFVDGEMRAQSRPLKRGEAPQTLRASLREGDKELRLVTLLKSADPGVNARADWLEIRAFE